MNFSVSNLISELPQYLVDLLCESHVWDAVSSLIYDCTSAYEVETVLCDVLGYDVTEYTESWGL